ncbi:unnamed protein product [Notodromas monacha]|uniref:Uncharacterized protein n=1 Tax=Notodromas monacha TaxID=399045 RepID=A0A7R9GKS3_9CRUS|nr:unnamed protein product [Notodromas monacha]CAG0924942.1 unnamed protein product [Notodromas monacha]
MNEARALQTFNNAQERLNSFLRNYSQDAKQLSSEVDAILFDLPDNLLENALFILCRGHERSIRCDPVMNMNLISLILNRLKFHKSAKHPRIHPISSSRKKDVFALFAVKHFQQIIRLVCLAFSLPDERLLSFYESEVTRMIQDEDYLSAVYWTTELNLPERLYEPLLLPIGLHTNLDMILKKLLDTSESLRIKIIEHLDKMVDFPPGRYLHVCA